LYLWGDNFCGQLFPLISTPAGPDAELEVRGRCVLFSCSALHFQHRLSRLAPQILVPRMFTALPAGIVVAQGQLMNACSKLWSQALACSGNLPQPNHVFLISLLTSQLHAHITLNFVVQLPLVHTTQLPSPACRVTCIRGVTILRDK
jgi:hypothetical protein